MPEYIPPTQHRKATKAEDRAPSGTDQAEGEEQDEGSNNGDDQRLEESGAPVDEGTGYEPANKGADQAHDNVA